MRPCERESRGVVVKYIIRIACGVASEASITLVNITIDAAVLIVRFRVGMASGAGYLGIVSGVAVAIGTGAPLSIVFTTINRKILSIVVECGRRPGIFTVTTGAIRRELSRGVVWIRRLNVIRVMAPIAGIGCVVVITIVTSRTIIGDGGVGSV